MIRGDVFVLLFLLLLLFSLFFVRATVVKQKAGIAVKLLARVSTDRGDVALLSAHAASR